MKDFFLLILLIVLLVLAYFATISIPEQPDYEKLCLEKGGVPIMNWNNSQLKDCKK